MWIFFVHNNLLTYLDLLNIQLYTDWKVHNFNISICHSEAGNILIYFPLDNYLWAFSSIQSNIWLFYASDKTKNNHVPF